MGTTYKCRNCGHVFIAGGVVLRIYNKCPKCGSYKTGPTGSSFMDLLKDMFRG